MENYVIQLDKTRLLKYDFNAFAEFEEQTGKTVMSLISGNDFGFTTIRSLLWAGLRANYPSITIGMTGTILQKAIDDGKDFQEIFQHIIKALQKSGMFKASENIDLDGIEVIEDGNEETEKKMI